MATMLLAKGSGTALLHWLLRPRTKRVFTRDEQQLLSKLVCRYITADHRVFQRLVSEGWLMGAQSPALSGQTLDEFNRRGQEHPDGEIGNQIMSCIGDVATPAFQRAAILVHYERCNRHFRTILQSLRFKNARLTTPSNHASDPNVVMIPTKSFAYALWECSGEVTPPTQAATLGSWNPGTISIHLQTYEKWQESEHRRFCKTLLPCLMGIQARILNNQHAVVLAELVAMRKLSTSDLINQLANESFSEKYDQAAMSYILASRALIMDHEDETLVPSSVTDYLLMWYIWRKIEAELLQNQRQRAAYRFTVREDRFNNLRRIVPDAPGWFSRFSCVGPTLPPATGRFQLAPAMAAPQAS